MTPAPGAHLLIVDDYPDALDVWSILLRARGYRVSTAVDGASAIAAARRLRPDLVVLDLELPRVSGFEVARVLRDDPRTHDLPLIAATGYSHQRHMDLASDAGFDRIVIKPIEPERLVDDIEQLLAARHGRPGELDHTGVEHAAQNW